MKSASPLTDKKLKRLQKLRKQPAAPLDTEYGGIKIICGVRRGHGRGATYASTSRNSTFSPAFHRKCRRFGPFDCHSCMCAFVAFINNVWRHREWNRWLRGRMRNGVFTSQFSYIPPASTVITHVPKERRCEEWRGKREKIECDKLPYEIKDLLV